MYREAFRRQACLRTTSTARPTSSWRTSRPVTAHRLRYLSTPTPLPPPDQRQVPGPSATPLPPPPEDKPPQSPPPPPSSSASSAEEPSQGDVDNADKLSGLKAQFRELTHGALDRTRRSGDEFTRHVARMFAQLGKELNRMTGYEEIEALKRRVVEQEAKINKARETAREAKEAYDRAVLQRAKCQREVNDLLQRKSHWTDEDVSRFTSLVREDHAREQDEARAKTAAAAAEDAVEREFSELMRVILNRYHEEQAWSDKIRSASTYGSLAALALNMAVFVLAIIFVEPWKRRRLAQTFERKFEEMNAATAQAFESRTGELKERLDEQGRMLALMLETVHLSAQVSDVELASLAAKEESGAGPEAEPSGSGRISATTLPERDLLLVAMTASAAAAGVLGWLARSWYG
ncbi:hypothetical protein OH77DRAFT_1423358 [Trametes cingulata]|nr:hypothetical protein OH77DRAFT_1423358 [Trametes cingulata]